MARHEGAKARRAAANRRSVSKPKQDPGPRRGTPDWDLALIDGRHVQTLVSARKVGLPLAMAAEMAGIPAELANLWLVTGRQMERLGDKQPTAQYMRDCREFARQWDTAAVGLIAVLRGFTIEHARKDPKACAQALASYEREYVQRRRRIQSTPAYEQQHRELGPDLAEPFAPLELTAQAGPSANLRGRLTHTNPDGSSTSAEFATGDSFGDEMEGRTDEELDFYALHGSWPHEAPQRPIDTTAEDVEEDAPEGEVEEEIARLQGALKGEGAPDGTPAGPNPIRPPDAPVRPFVGPIHQPPIVALPPRPPPLRRRNPEDGLQELTDPVAVVLPPPKPPKIPAFAPLPRRDPDQQ